MIHTCVHSPAAPAPDARLQKYTRTLGKFLAWAWGGAESQGGSLMQVATVITSRL